MKIKKIIKGSIPFLMIFSLTSCSLKINSNNNNSSLSEIEYVYNFLKANGYVGVSDRELYDGMIYGLTNAMNDPFTYYTSANNGETQDYSSSGVGYGFVRTLYYGEALVKQVMKDSPCEKAGLKEGDIVTKVAKYNNENEKEVYKLTDYPISSWNLIFSGEDKQLVDLYVKRKNESGNYISLSDPIRITLGKYNQNKVKVDYITNERGYSEAYVELTSFLGDKKNNESVPDEELKDIFDTQIFTKYDTLDHLIIDLRGNGGGYVNNCVNALSLFIPENEPCVYYLFSDGTYSSLNNTKYDKQYTSLINKITLIIDDDSASAAESFAVGLRDSSFTKDKVSIVGQVSYGKGIAQSFLSLFNDNSLIRYTFAKVCSPTKECINKRGIVPSFFVGEEHISYDKYQRFIEGVNDNSSLSNDDKEIILSRINLLLNSNIIDFDEAITKCKSYLKIKDGNSLYNKDFSEKFQDKFYDNVITSLNNIFTGYVEGVENNDDLSSAQRKFIKAKINYLLNEDYPSFDKALKAFQEKYNIVDEDNIYNRQSSMLLQGLLMDVHIENYENKTLEEIRNLYESKAI